MSTKRLMYTVLGACVLVLATAGPAAAHVTVQPGEAMKGSFTKVAFRVPNESDTAGTVKLEVTFPGDTPIASVRTKPVPGWTAERRMATLTTPVESHGAQITEAVRTIIWTAQPGTRIAPGEFAEFEVSLGRLPEDVDRLVLPAVQTYDDGDVVRWEDPPPAEGGEEPERPAPVLELTEPDTEDEAAHDDGSASAANAQATVEPDDQATAGRDDTARWLGGAGLVAGALGLGLGIGAVVAARRRTT